MRTDETLLNVVATDIGLLTVFQAENVKVKRIVYLDESSTARLAYRVQFYLEEVGQKPSRPLYIIDAKTLNICLRVESLENYRKIAEDRGWKKREQAASSERRYREHPRFRRQAASCPASESAKGRGGNVKYGELLYGVSEPYCLPTEFGPNPGECKLRNKNGWVTDLNAEGTATEVRFTCADGYDDEVNGGYGPANDCFFFIDNVAQMFIEGYGYNVFPGGDGYTEGVQGRVHRRRYDNAFWNGQYLTFGDGEYYFYPMVSQDVVAHEYAHAVTEKNSGLIYSGQSGGMNEAFSDITGEVAEQFWRGYNDWMVGAQITKFAGPLRYMDDPRQDGRSINHIADYTGQDVHYTSGIYNQAFYHLVQIAVSVTSDAYGETVTQIGVSPYFLTASALGRYFKLSAQSQTDLIVTLSIQ